MARSSGFRMTERTCIRKAAVDEVVALLAVAWIHSDMNRAVLRQVWKQVVWRKGPKG